MAQLTHAIDLQGNYNYFLSIKYYLESEYTIYVYMCVCAFGCGPPLTCFNYLSLSVMAIAVVAVVMVVVVVTIVFVASS